MYYEQFPGALPAGGTTLTAASELAYIQSQPSGQNPIGTTQGIVVKGYLNVTGGATGGGWSIKCRRGAGTGGAQVGSTQTYTMPATTTVSIPYSFVDPGPAWPAGLVYTITVTAAGSNGTSNDGSIEVLTPETGTPGD